MAKKSVGLELAHLQVRLSNHEVFKKRRRRRIVVLILVCLITVWKFSVKASETEIHGWKIFEGIFHTQFVAKHNDAKYSASLLVSPIE